MRIDWKQYRTLVRLFMLLQMRGKGGKSASRLTALVVSYAIGAMYLGWTLTVGFFEPVFVLVSTTVVVYLSGFTIITAYPTILLTLRERTIFDSFPLDKRTFILARLTNLAIYLLVSTIPFAIPLTAFFFPFAATGAQPFFYFLTLIMAAFWTAFVFLLFYILILRNYRHNTAVVSVIQLALFFLLLIMYQSMPRYYLHAVNWAELLASPVLYIFPPAWFAALHWELSGVPMLPHQVELASLALTTTIGLVGSLSMGWLISKAELAGPLEQHVSRKPRVTLLDRFLLPRLLRRSERSAGYHLFSQIAFRERNTRLQILPIALMPVAVAIYGLISGELHSPFPRLMTGWYSKMHVPVLIFFLFAARHIEQIIHHAPHTETRWILLRLTSAQLAEFGKGVRFAVFARIHLPSAVLLFMLFLVDMPILESFLQTCFLLTAAKFQTSSLNLLQPKIPFIASEAHLAAFQRLSQFFIVIPFFIVILLFHYAASFSLIAFVLMLGFVFNIALWFDRMGAKRLSQKLIEAA